jgi:hypothetical protein
MPDCRWMVPLFIMLRRGPMGERRKFVLLGGAPV